MRLIEHVSPEVKEKAGSTHLGLVVKKGGGGCFEMQNSSY